MREERKKKSSRGVGVGGVLLHRGWLSPTHSNSQHPTSRGLMFFDCIFGYCSCVVAVFFFGPHGNGLCTQTHIHTHRHTHAHKKCIMQKKKKKENKGQRVARWTNRAIGNKEVEVQRATITNHLRY